MLEEQEKLISDIENLCYILLTYCEINIEDEEIQKIHSLVNCIYSKVENLYGEINN